MIVCSNPLRRNALAAWGLALSAIVAAEPLTAQVGPQPARPDYYPHFQSCEDLKTQCQGATAEEIYNAAFLESWGQPVVKLGLCYVHDKTNCPGCACNNYVKQTHKSGAKGWDDGTGCVGGDPAASKAMAAAILKQLCDSGACCCPQVEAKPCPNPNPVRRCGDAVSSACCTFPNECSAPGAAEGWFPG